MESDARSCTNSECKFATDGKCIEGYPLDDCPHLRRLAVEDIQENLEAEPGAPETARAIQLAMGEALDRGQAAVLQRRNSSRAVGLIGPNDAGKTSLIAGLFDLMQDGPVADVGFAGSSTLVGFEKICHDARAASRRGTPHTERTSVGADATFFHLDVKPADGSILSLFVGDRSGEDYLGATDEVARSSAFFELRRADTITLLVNGAHLAGSEFRHEAKAVASQVIGALAEGGAIRSRSRLAVVLTKEDLVLASQHAARVEREFKELVAAIEEQHQDLFHEVRAFSVAASPSATDNCARGKGIDDLLRYWLLPPQPEMPTPALHLPAATRMIDAFGQRAERAK
jgi:hypothetical protein